MADERLLAVSNLSVTFRGARRQAPVQAVRGIDLSVRRGQTIGLVGESGSGKSTAVRAILQLVRPDPGATVEFLGRDLTRLRGRTLRRLRRRMQMVFQDPYASLDPQWPVGASIAEPLQIHTDMSQQAREQRVMELLNLVNLDPEYKDRYPHEFSGGQRQRLAIARAMALEPDLVICDEAVSALDVSTQNQIIQLLRAIQQRTGVAYIFISHDLSVVRTIADHVLVMYLGKVVEEGAPEQLFQSPAHPYTQALLSAVPVPNPSIQRSRTRIVLQGDLPDPRRPPPACAFHPRCRYVMDICREQEPALTARGGGGYRAACHLDPPLPAP